MGSGLEEGQRVRPLPGQRWSAMGSGLCSDFDMKASREICEHSHVVDDESQAFGRAQFTVP